MLRHMSPVSVHVGGTVIEESDTARNLGVTFDRSLTFSAHIAGIKTRCNGLLVALSHIKHSFPSELIETVVQSLVISIVRHCISVYGGTSQTHMKHVQSELNFCARVMSGRRKYDHISDVVNQNFVLNAKQLAYYHNVRYILSQDSHDRTATTISMQLRTKHRYNRPEHPSVQRHPSAAAPVRRDSGKRQFVYRAAAEFNLLPPDVRSLNRTRFANTVKGCLP